MCVRVCACKCMFKCAYVCTCVFVCKWVCVCVHACMDVCVRVCVIVAVAVFPKSNELLKSVLMITKTKWRTLEVAILCSGKNKFERGFIHRFIIP